MLSSSEYWVLTRQQVMPDILASKKIVIIGLGLIGGSIARGLSVLRKDIEITAVGRNETVLQEAQTEG
ncbi:MAG: hypothetical protein ACKVKR_00905, partial [Pseudomonadales bacterium]